MSKKHKVIDIDYTKADHLTSILLGDRSDPLKTPIYTPFEVRLPEGFEALEKQVNKEKK